VTTDLRVPLLVVGLLGVTVSVWVVAGPIASIQLPRPSAPDSSTQAGRSGIRIPPESVVAIASRDPFRIGRRPLLPAYDPLRLAEQVAPQPPKPTLTLVGLVNGSAPSAVIEGLPGVEGSRVVRVGDIVAGLHIKKITNGQVVVAGMDTTWVLEVREPWKN